MPFFDGIIASLSDADRARAEADPLDVLIIVRGYSDEEKRMEASVGVIITQTHTPTQTYAHAHRETWGATPHRQEQPVGLAGSRAHALNS